MKLQLTYKVAYNYVSFKLKIYHSAKLLYLFLFIKKKHRRKSSEPKPELLSCAVRQAQINIPYLIIPLRS